MNLSARAVFLDRDGVINRKAPDTPEISYIAKTVEFEFIPGALEAIAEFGRSGYKVFVVTNQRGVARGLVRLSDLDEIHASMIRAIERAGGKIEQVYFCPHDYADRCDCRKPKPGMLLHAQREHSIDLLSSWMVGDSRADIEAGKQAGCRTAIIGAETADIDADVRAATLRDAVQSIQAFDEANKCR